ncbi:hypothetical protein [Pseudoduganella violacea]|uniref:Band 7 domain-containing protein n=1 Tax=Pseudoduganella violacea TaxID=1715466 RepID=A0A7W5BE06_9BURK|nr:hypothetical protein [Pseudoduganella violacea]MBB3121150.1 hypothetical protein [Pseudoduganella violacea]
MFKMFGFGGSKCVRCEHKNAEAAAYCAQCGLSLGAARNEPVLRDNRWIPANDELAVYFGVRQLSGLFSKTLRVPPTTRAYILQGSQATEVPQGEYELEGFFTRLNNLLRDQHAEILITRTTPLPVEFHFGDLPSAEHLKVAARFSVGIKVENVAAFAQHFMLAPGAVTALQLHELLAPSVRQIAAEFIGARSLREMSGNPDLRVQLDERLQALLKQRLAEFGLAVAQVETLSLRHDKFDNNRERVGSLWLVADERHAQLEHVKQLDQLYDDEEWQVIWREEQKRRSEYRRGELRVDAAVDKAELAQQEAERVQAIRAREVELYGRIVDAKTRKLAFERGAGAVLTELEHELAQKKAARSGEAAQWDHVRQLAQIRMRTELEVAQQETQEQRQLASQRFSHQLHVQQIRNQIEKALAIEDEALRRAQLQRLRQAEDEAQRREASLEAEQHKARFQGLSLANAARQREAERVQEWEELQHAARQRELGRGEEAKDAEGQVQLAQITAKLEELKRAGAGADSMLQYEKLLRTIEADAIQQRKAQELNTQGMLDQVVIEEQRLHLKQKEQEAQWQQELKKLAQQREESYARWKHEYDSMVAQQEHAAALARIEIEKAQAIGSLSDTAKVALAPTANAQALAQLLKVQAQSGMSADQIQALAAVVAAENSMTPAEAMRLAEDRARQERSHADSQADKDRAHQLELLKLQNATHANALASQMQLGVGVAQAGAPVRHHHTAAAPGLRYCINGHAIPADTPNAKFCAECGVPLR